MAKHKIDLSIIIVTYNSQFWLQKCLTSLGEYIHSSKYKIKVIVIDNNSHDDTKKMIEKEFNWVNYHQLSENTGFAVANNIGLAMTKSKYHMLLNSDVEFTSETQIDKMLKYLDSHPQVGVLTPRIELVNGQLDQACHRGEPTIWASLTYFTGLERLFPQYDAFGQYHLTTKDLSKIHIIDACSGAAMIVRASAIKDVGTLDERFFMYAEDLDWCKRFRDSNYLIIFYPHSKVVHHKYKSGIKNTSQKIATQTRRHFFDTMLQYYDKHYADQHPSIVRWLIKVFVVIKKGAV